MKDSTPKTRRDIEWEKRRLCSDEACIGVIGSDGRCKECGRPYEGEVSAVVEDEYQAQGLDPDNVDTLVDEPDTAEEETVPDTEWENRRLCSDEACIGVIGNDSRCKECGKPYEGNGS